MNAFERLKIEINGIEDIIIDYTEDGRVLNYITELKNSLQDADYEATRYCIDGIIKWYEAEMPIIKNDDYVMYPASHMKSLELLREIFDELSERDFITAPVKKMHPQKADKAIFISHNSKDKKYGDALRDYIIGLGVKDSQLIYTSHPMNKIPMDANIYDYLRQNICSEIFMIILWSDTYLESPACLNEMGAGWVMQADYTNVYVPTFSFGNPKYHECAVDTRKMGAVLNGDQHCKASMIELKKKIEAMFELKNDEQKTTYLLDEFIKAITEGE